jgi:hypothetical protein
MTKGKRRRFTAQHKLDILKQADACSKKGSLGSLLRREGLDFKKIDWKKVFIVSFDFDKMFLRNKWVELIYEGYPIKRKMLIDYRTLMKFIKSNKIKMIERIKRNPHFV